MTGATKDSTIRIGEWENGFAFWPARQPNLRLYLWFYEWNLFDAVTPGEHTPGRHEPHKTLGIDLHGTLSHPGLVLQVEAAGDGAEFKLFLHNESGHDWPDVAAIIPCFNPGVPDFDSLQAPPTRVFFDDQHERTWFASARGLELLSDRAIHFNAALRPAIETHSRDGQFVFSGKWPSSPVDAQAGIMLRESVEGNWIAGIAWDDFVSAQGHNPWRCMHLGIRVGPLARGEVRQLRGRLYLMEGTKEACYEKFKQEFA